MLQELLLANVTAWTCGGSHGNNPLVKYSLRIPPVPLVLWAIKTFVLPGSAGLPFWKKFQDS